MTTEIRAETVPLHPSKAMAGLFVLWEMLKRSILLFQRLLRTTTVIPLLQCYTVLLSLLHRHPAELSLKRLQ
jgi:hypothetical protein